MNRQKDALLSAFVLICMLAMFVSLWPGCTSESDNQQTDGTSSYPKKTYRNVVYSKPDGNAQRLDVFLPEGRGPFPVVMYIHGGGWHSGDKRTNLAGWLVEYGYAVVNVNYRLSSEAIFPAQIHDCKAAVRWLRANADRLGFDVKRVGVWGDSAGGHLAALLGTSGGIASLEGRGGYPKQSSRVQAVCSFYGPVDLDSAWRETTVQGEWGAYMYERLLGASSPDDVPELIKRASPVSHVTPDDPPFLIIHGTEDELIAVKQSGLLDDALETTGVKAQLHILEGLGHGGPGFLSLEVKKIILNFWDTNLRR